MKKIILTVLVLAFVFIQTADSQNVGDEAPDFNVELLGGGDFTLSEYSGKVVMLFFFGNSCPYCIASGPKVEEVYQIYRDTSKFIALGLDTWNSSSTFESVAGFKASSGVTFPLAISAGSVSNSYSTTYDRLLVVDKKGIIRHKGTSAAINDIATVSSLIDVLIMEPDSAASDPDTTDTTVTTNGQIESNRSEISLYPNPANEFIELNLSALNDQSVDLYIYDISGKMLIERSYYLNNGSNRLRLNTQNLEQGIYIYKLTINGGNRTGRFFIQK